MPSWFSQVTANTTTPATSKNKTKPPAFTKKVAPAPPKPTRPPSSRAAPQPMLPVPKPHHSGGPTARAGKTAAEGKHVPPTELKSRRVPFSSIQVEAGAHTGYPEHGGPRMVRFRLQSSITTEPSPLPQPRGPEYVTVPERERRAAPPPSSAPLPVPPSVRRNSHPHIYAYAAAGENAYADAPVYSYAPRVGPIKLLRSLNGGTFGASYVAHDHGTGRVVCARVFEKARLRAEAKIKHGLLVEARCYKTIAAGPPRDRAHLMELYGILQDERRVLFVMPLMQCDLLDALGAARRLDRALVRRWVAQLALGIDALHRMGIIHRDIKPENILLDAPGPAGNVRIADFNAALVVQAGRPLADGEVYAQDAVGSVPYIAWETAQRRWYGKMVDWWALGCLAFDLLTNTLLFEDDGARKTYAQWDRKLEGISYLSYAGDLTDEEESVIAGLVHLHPSSRYQLRHLRHHSYFLDENRVNVFDVLAREPPADLLTVGRSLNASLSLGQVDEALQDAPLVHAAPRPPRVRTGHACAVDVDAAMGGADDVDFGAFGWVNARGIWGVHTHA